MHRPAHVTFIHGLGNKPCRRELRRIWLEALGAPLKEDAGFDLGAVGVTASFVYWADLFYPEPLAAAHYESRADQLAASVAADPQLVDDDWTRSLLA